MGTKWPFSFKENDILRYDLDKFRNLQGESCERDVEQNSQNKIIVWSMRGHKSPEL